MVVMLFRTSSVTVDGFNRQHRPSMATASLCLCELASQVSHIQASAVNHSSCA